MTLHLASKEGLLDIVKNYIENEKTDINSLNRTKDSALHYSSLYSQPHISKYLISKGINVGLENNEGYTSLNYASKNNNFENIKLLIDAGAIFSKPFNCGKTPLIFAIELSNLKTVKFLIDKYQTFHFDFINSEFKDKASKSSYEIIEYINNKYKIFNFKNSLNNSLITKSIKNKSDVLIHFFLEIFNNNKDISINQLFIKSLSNSDNFEIVDFLISELSNINIHIKNNKQQNALHILILKNSIIDSNLVNLLIEENIDVNSIDYLGNTALHYYLYKILDERDDFDRNPMHDAMKNFFLEEDIFIIKYLLDSGANQNAINIRGHTPKDLVLKINDIYLTQAFELEI